MTVNYICPRCGYETKQKNHIRRHLYEKKTPCPGKVKCMELNDEIKKHILENCVWNPSPPAVSQQTIVNQQINNYMQLNACIQKLDTVEKLTKVLNHTNKNLVEFDQHIMNILLPQLERLQQDDDVSMNTVDLYTIIDSVTTYLQPEKINVIYDATSDKIMIYNEGTWKSYILEAGITELVACIKHIYLDSYELYLVKKYMETTMRAKSMSFEHLIVYYRFLACHDMKPFIFGMTDGQILGSQNTSFDIEEHLYRKFKEQTDDLRVSELRSTRASIANIIKRNTKTNILELNKLIMDLIQMDDAFKTATLKSIERIVF